MTLHHRHDRWTTRTRCRPPRSAVAGSTTSRATATPSCPGPADLADDPTLLFVIAGMVPFIPYLHRPARPPPFPRATSVQKCVRTLDIEEVGKTTRHGTFFQMNGNFSFGDYFKEGAIELRLGAGHRARRTTGGYGFDPRHALGHRLPRRRRGGRRSGSRSPACPTSGSSAAAGRTTSGHMGVPGPAGPCSEIFFDRGPEYGPEGGPVVDEDRYLEIWNLVFMQYERGAGGGKEDFPILGDLPKKNIDTGMGLERVAYLLQGVDNLYEIDEVFPVLERRRGADRQAYGADHDGRRPAARRRRPRAQRR